MDIATLSKMDDAALMKALGLDKKLDDAKSSLDKLAAMPEGKGKAYAEERIKCMFEPHVYPDDFKYILESAQRKDNPKSGKEEACCCEPCCF